MSDDPLLQMCEAQAIATEQQAVIHRFEGEKEEMAEKLRRLELGREGKPGSSNEKIEQSSNKNLDDVWAAVNELKNNLQNKCTDMNNLLERTWADVNSLQQKMNENSIKIDQIQNTVTQQAEQFDCKVESIINRIKGETILIMGGVNNNNKEFAGMAVLSADRSEWIEIKLELPYEILGSGVVYLDGEIYLFGGVNNPKALYKLDKIMKWIPLADMNEGRSNITNSCLEWNGYIWVFGGWNEKDEPLKSVERYDPMEDKWTPMSEMKTARSSAATALWNDKIIISTGFVTKSTVTRTMECFDPEDVCWDEFPDMPKKNVSHSLVTYKNKLILIGGTGNETHNTVWELDPLQPNAGWKPLRSMKYPSYSFAGIVLDNEIYAIGGEQGIDLPDLSRVEIFHRKHWRDGPSLPYKWRKMSSVIIPQHFADRLCAYKP